MFAPLSKSRRTIFSFPCCAAICNGVTACFSHTILELSLNDRSLRLNSVNNFAKSSKDSVLTSAPLSIKNSAMLSLSFAIAICNAVWLYVVRASMSALCVRSSFMTSKLASPASAATCSAERPALSCSSRYFEPFFMPRSFRAKL
ncbi:hypothetical protein FN846DRAFT_942528 [Sphaerosporella brunnea]|uniref:Uncharacterized protein n=1 Tax=Sphaerosporella brunnea TaxID=1250544 RepID=A0A5J5F189_9PEZI|nr:hypothetical protein FN846DRAFT_942528 [Sphaerosporella brunnea]